MLIKKVIAVLLCANFAKTFASHPCERNCNGEIKICKYHFKLENFYTLDTRACFDCPKNVTDCYRKDCIPGGGIKRNLYTINRSFPGPTIEVCQFDIVSVTVENAMFDDISTTIHWHGQHMLKSPYSDGVPWITQCPILSNTNFTYVFEAAQHGTHYWHSHDRSERGDGVFGGLIVKVPKYLDPHRGLYNEDLSQHQVLITDWNRKLKSDLIGDFLHNQSFPLPDGILINGWGPLNVTEDNQIPFAKFTVEKGKKYRFRFVDAAFWDCPMSISIDNHNLTVISSDGFNLEPKEVTSFVMHNGERYDFILNANQAADTYWIRVKAISKVCSRKKVFQLGLLQYESSTQNLPTAPKPTYETATIEGPKMLNDLDDNEGIKISTIKSLEPCDSELMDSNVEPIYIQISFLNVSSPVLYHPPYYDQSNVPAKLQTLNPAINNIVFKDPPRPLLPNKWLFESGSHFCTEESLKANCTTEYCHCTQVIDLPLNKVVELIVYVGGNVSVHHPMHLHGGAFHVVAWDNLDGTITKEDIQKLDRNGLIKRNYDYPPIKDTLAVINGGYAVLRFKTINPGYWLYHCHVDVHSETGMRVVFRIGSSQDMKPVPYNFPNCGSLY